MALLTQYAKKPLILPKKGIIVDSSLVLNAPLWHPHLSLSPFTTKAPNPLSCTVVGATWSPIGRVFDGENDKITCGDIDLLDAFTLEAWIYRHVLNEAFNIIDKYYVTSYAFLVLGTNYLRLHTSSTSVLTDDTTPLAANRWHHAAVTYDGNGNGAIYADGLQIKTGTGLTDCQNNANLTKLGIDDTENFPSDGLIGEARIYNRALSASEIQQNFLATKWRYQ